MRLLVTGSAGFVGGSVGRFAAQSGHSVLGIARRSQPDLDWPGQHVTADVNYADLTSTIESFEPNAILHAAGSASVGASMNSPLEDFRAAVVSWINLLDTVRRSGQRPLIIFPSSAAVYGDPSSLPVSESAPIAPISPYGFHKAACELVAREYATCFGLTIIVIRVFSVFGPMQRRLLLWDLYQRAIADASEIWLEGTGEESRDYIHIDDLASLILMLASAQDGVRQDLITVNAGRGEETPVVVAAEHMRRACGVIDKPIVCLGKTRVGDPQRWQADVKLLRKLAPSWRPGELTKGIDSCVKFWQRQ